MSDEHPISLKMELGRAVFESSRRFALLQEDVEAVYAYLEQVEPEYRTVAYEGASMALAFNDFSKPEQAGLWPLFLKNAAALYVPDIHTGLGCAAAQHNKLIVPLLRASEPAMDYRILDGYGFYQGMFRYRQAVLQQSFPAELAGSYPGYHDQGLGRSLWYRTGGDCEKTATVIGTFSMGRQAELWRGIGIAATYLGGSGEQRLKRLFSAAAPYQCQLLSGAAISARARSKAGTSGADIELACRLWCGLPATDTAALADRLFDEIFTRPQKSYASWVSALDKQFDSSPRYQFSS
jgi:enediyne biosynthesis protein E3